MISFSYISEEQFEFIILKIINKLLKNSGFILHASSIVYKKKLFIFVGDSGVGKTTISNLLSRNKDIKKLSDDSIIIKMSDNTFFGYKTILNDNNSFNFEQNIGYTIAGVFFIKQSKFFKMQIIKNKKKFINKFIKQLFIFNRPIKQKLQKKTIKIVFKFLDQIFLYQLEFPNKADLAKEFLKTISDIYLCLIIIFNHNLFTIRTC